MATGRSDRGPLRIRRRGRHSAPTQVEKVAQQAGKAAPAVAIAGALVAAPQASQALAASATPVTTHSQAATVSSTDTAAKAPSSATRTVATLDAVTTRAVTVSSAKPTKHTATTQSTTYRVRSGDTLSKLANEFFHNDDWQYLFHENDKTVSDPNLIYVGQSLYIPASAPAHYTLSDYTPRHAKTAEVAAPVTQPVVQSVVQSVVTSTTSSQSAHTSSQPAKTSGSTVVVQAASQNGDYSCSGLEQIWEQAGGNPADAFMAAEIAMAESGGDPNAISPTDDYGLWQINASNGALATLNPLQNAKSAVTLSDNGTNWDPWTTYTSGLYAGRC
jgi:LysM repeat protein